MNSVANAFVRLAVAVLSATAALAQAPASTPGEPGQYHVSQTFHIGGDVFASCGDGTLTVARETAPGKYEVVQTVPTPRGARTMGVDPTTHTLYLPTAEFNPPAEGQTRPRPKPGTFVIVVVSRG